MKQFLLKHVDRVIVISFTFIAILCVGISSAPNIAASIVSPYVPATWGTGYAISGTNNQVAFFTGASDLGSDAKLTWDNVNKRLGIGTVSPQRLVHIVGNICLFERNVNSAGFIINRNGADVTGYNRWVFGVDEPTGFVIKTYPFDGATGTQVWEQLVITKDDPATPANESKVGIGTTSPTAKLEVNGSVKATSSINKQPTNPPLFRWLPIKVLATYTGTGGPYAITFDGTNMWTANAGGNSVTKVNPAGQMTTYTGTGSQPIGIAFDGTNMWTANYGDNSVTKITPTGAMTTYTAVGVNPYAIAFDGTNMWTANYGDNSVTKITPAGVITIYTGTGISPSAIAFDGINMWTADYGSNSVTKITPAGVMTTYTGTGLNPYGIAFDGANMWTVNAGANSVTRISPSGGMTTYTGTGSGPWGIAFDGTNMWTANAGGNSVTKVTLAGEMTIYTGTGSHPIGIAFDGTNMWTANYDDSSLTKILVITQ